jgi:hypothetical protein
VGGQLGPRPSVWLPYTMANLSLEGGAQAHSMVAVGSSYITNVDNMPRLTICPPS